VLVVGVVSCPQNYSRAVLVIRSKYDYASDSMQSCALVFARPESCNPGPTQTVKEVVL
jgi:hypothetical protein